MCVLHTAEHQDTMLCRVHCVTCGLPTLDEDIKNIIVGMEAAYTQDSLSGPSSRPLNHMCQVKIHGMELFDPCECRNHVGSMFSSPATSKLGPLRTKLTYCRCKPWPKMHPPVLRQPHGQSSVPRPVPHGCLHQ